MLHKVISINTQKTFLEALGFYLILLFFWIILVALFGTFFFLAPGDTPAERGFNGGVIGCVIYCMLLPFVILKARGLLLSANSFLIFVGGILGWLLGLPAGLLVAAFISTMQSSHNKD
ncbi:hypothetical protein SOPP22_15880 [Shewanella sp. OPT22]|nr:hypothetical protein SOPP22_15880 [Shewanella sp. OPT22]